jgi:ribonuclease HI
MLIDEQGQPVSGPDKRVEIIYRLGGKPYRAALKNLEDVPGAVPIREGDTQAMEPAGDSAGHALLSPSPSLPGIHVAKKAPQLPEAIHVYTDGACTGNPGPMGVGVVILDPSHPGAQRRELSDYLGMGTNNIAELTAIKRGISDLPRQRPVILYTDSSYAIGVLAQGWRARANQELVLGMRQLLGEFHQLYFIKVAGHSGVPENERCDELARAAIARKQP